MEANFTRSLEFVLKEEGGYSADPRDPGGMTNLGVTARTLGDWTGHQPSEAEMRALSAADVAPIYHGRYWLATSGDKLPPGVDLFTFDTAVNCGPGRALKWLQTAVGVEADGKVGPATLAAVRGSDELAVLRELEGLREAHYRSLPTFDHFGRGWMDRLGRVGVESAALANGH